MERESYVWTPAEEKQVLTIRSVADVEPLIGRAMYGVSLRPKPTLEI